MRGEKKKKNDNDQLGINNVTPGTVIYVSLQFYAVKNSFMGGYFILFLIFYFSGTFKHCPGHRDRHAISGTIPVNPGRITCMLKYSNAKEIFWGTEHFITYDTKLELFTI